MEGRHAERGVRRDPQPVGPVEVGGWVVGRHGRRGGRDPRGVTDLAEHVGLAQSAASQHLAKLRAAGLVTTRRSAQTIYYRLGDPGAARVIDVLCELYRKPGTQPPKAR